MILTAFCQQPPMRLAGRRLFRHTGEGAYGWDGPRPSPGRREATLPLGADERLDLGVGFGLPAAAVEDAVMADFELEVLQLFRWRDAGA